MTKNTAEVASLDATNINDIYYRGCTFLVKQINTTSAEQLLRGMEVVIPGLKNKILFLFDDKTGLISEVVVLLDGIPTDETLRSDYLPLSLSDYKGMENLIIYTAAKAVCNELTTAGVVSPITDLNTNPSNTSNTKILKLVEVSGKKLTSSLLDDQSYPRLARVFKPVILESKEKVETESTQNLQLNKKFEEQSVPIKEMTREEYTSSEHYLKQKQEFELRAETNRAFENKISKESKEFQEEREREFTLYIDVTEEEMKSWPRLDTKEKIQQEMELGRQWWRTHNISESESELSDSSEWSNEEKADKETVRNVLKTLKQQNSIAKSSTKNHEESTEDNWLSTLVKKISKNVLLLLNYERSALPIKNITAMQEIMNGKDMPESNSLNEATVKSEQTYKRSLEFKGSDHENLDNL